MPVVLNQDAVTTLGAPEKAVGVSPFYEIDVYLPKKNVACGAAKLLQTKEGCGNS